MDYLRRNPLLGIIVIFVLTASSVVVINKQDERAREKAAKKEAHIRQVQICEAVLGNALTIRDLIDLSLARSTNPQAQTIVQEFYDRIELPPKICIGSGVDVKRFFRRIPVTTSTTIPTTQSTSAAGPRGPQGPSGPSGTVVVVQPSNGGNEEGGRTTTTTSSTTTTTTRSTLLPPITVPVSTQAYRTWGHGWAGWYSWARRYLTSHRNAG